MKDKLQALYLMVQDLAKREDGQDLVEYALIVALIAFGSTAGMSSVAAGINSAFDQISTTLGAYIS